MRKERALSLLVCAALLLTAMAKTWAAAADNAPAGLSDAVSPYPEEYADTDNARTQVQAVFAESSSGTAMTDGAGYIVWRVEVPETGLYNLEITYRPDTASAGDIQRDLLIDGALPFKQASGLVFSRVFRDTADVFEQDANRNDIRPQQQEVDEWITCRVRDAKEAVAQPLLFRLTAGAHELRLESLKGSMEIQSVKLVPPEAPPDYADYSAQSAEGPDVDIQRFEGEHPSTKSSFTIQAFADRSPSTQPQDPVKIRYNAIGGSKWMYAGQWLEWSFEVEESGWYVIAPRYKQTAYSGGYVSRRLILDGKVPFAQAEAIRFNYADRWTVQPLGGDSGAYRFYLEKGKTHTLRLQVTLGDMAPVIEQVRDILNALNEDYLRILVITGSTPDLYRDYNFQALVPETIEDFRKQAAALEAVISGIQQETGMKGEFTSILQNTLVTLRKIEKDPESIAKYFQMLKDNLAAYGTWLQQAQQQPLDIDCFYVVPQGKEMPKAGGSFWSAVVFHVKAFVLSFLEDYQSVAAGITEEDLAGGNVVDTWIATGRDQSEIIQQLADQTLTPATDGRIRLNLQLVAGGSVLPSILAGIGPDVCLSMGSGDPLNFALRGAAMDLTRFPDLGDVLGRFSDSAMVPYRFNGGVWALPETQTFLMMFCRTDVLERLGLEPPATWDDFYDMIPVLQRQHLQAGFPVNVKPGTISGANLLAYKMFLYQNGGTLYNDSLTAGNLTQDVNLDTFKQLTQLFTLFNFPADYDFANRFRSGEMPIGFVDYTMYNQLTVFAPEISGQWEMLPLPATVREDGTMNSTSPSDGLSVIMLAGAENPDAAWEVLKWWTSARTQGQYAQEMESVLGPSAKHPTANLEALYAIPWTHEELSNLQRQMQDLTGTPELPGSYYTPRAVDFAFMQVYTQGDNPITALTDNARALDEEIARKRQEFGLS